MKIGAYVMMKDKLRDTYLEKFEFVEQYGQQNLISNKVMNEKMMDLIDMLLEAQENGTPAEQIIGADTLGFCKNYFADFTAADMLLSLAKGLVCPAWVLLIVESIFLFLARRQDGFGFFSFKDDISPFLIGFLSPALMSMIANIICFIMAKRGNYSKKTYSAVHIVFSVLSTVLIVVLLVCVLALDIAFEIPCAAILLPAASYLLIYYSIVMITRVVRYGTLKAPDSGYETSFKALVKDEMSRYDVANDPDIVKNYARRYRKVNKKRIRRGLEKLTTEEFFKKQNRENKYAPWIGVIGGYGVFFFFFGVLGKGIEFESSSDGVIFFAILAVFALLFVKLFRKAGRIAMGQQVKILAACSEKNLELDEYYEALLAEKADIK